MEKGVLYIESAGGGEEEVGVGGGEGWRERKG